MYPLIFILSPTTILLVVIKKALRRSLRCKKIIAAAGTEPATSWSQGSRGNHCATPSVSPNAMYLLSSCIAAKKTWTQLPKKKLLMSFCDETTFFDSGKTRIFLKVDSEQFFFQKVIFKKKEKKSSFIVFSKIVSNQKI